MNKIIVSSTALVERSGSKAQVSDKGFALPPKDWSLRIQSAHIFTVGDDGVVGAFPDRFEILLDKGQEPYPKGEYKFSPSAVSVSNNGRLEIRPRLIPVSAGKSAA
jgi:hypothetical protein